MDLLQLKYFSTTARMGSISKAATRLFVSQSTVSKSITALENALNVKLFDRVANGLQLNEAGRSFLRYAVQILELVDQAEKMVKNEDLPETGTAIYSVPCGGVLTDLEAGFLERYPRAHLKQRLLNSEQALRALQNRELDFAFSFQLLSAPGVEWFPICKPHFVAIMSAGHPLAGADTISLAALKNESFFANNINSDNAEMFTSLCKQAGFVPNMLYEGDDMLLSLKFIGENKAVSLSIDMPFSEIMQSLVYGDTASHPKICKVPISDELPDIEFGVSLLRGRHQNKTAQAFFEYVLRNMRGEGESSF